MIPDTHSGGASCRCGDRLPEKHDCVADHIVSESSCMPWFEGMLQRHGIEMHLTPGSGRFQGGGLWFPAGLPRLPGDPSKQIRRARQGKQEKEGSEISFTLHALNRDDLVSGREHGLTSSRLKNVGFQHRWRLATGTLKFWRGDGAESGGGGGKRIPLKSQR